PEQTAKMNDQIRRNVAYALINFSWLEHERIKRVTLVVCQSLEFAFQLVLKSIVFARWDHSIGLTSLHIEKNSSVVTAFAPDTRLAPIHIQLIKPSNGVRVFIQNQDALANQPFVDRNASVQPLRTMVGNHQHNRLFIEQIQRLSDLLIKP